MELQAKLQYGDLLERLAEVLDITPTQFKAAQDHYEAVGKYLSETGSPLEKYKPEISPQGSFLLGTVIKPLSDKDEYDIDLVCKLQGLNTGNTTQYNLKQLIGQRLKSHGVYAKMLDEEGRRCWTLVYADGTRFHMDILPSIPDDYSWLLSLGVPFQFAKSAINVTDMEAKNYKQYDRDWPRSNPLGYAEWFKEQMKVQLLEQKKIRAEKMRASIDKVPDHEVKTPLQRAIQIFKRHRDVMFGDNEHKPISIIITTLAAKAYKQEANLYDALLNLIDNMPRYIEASMVNGKVVKWVGNPVNPKENFADKWIEHPQREANFYNWLTRVKQDLTTAIQEKGLHLIAEKLKKPFGDRTITEAFKNASDAIRVQRENGQLKMAERTAILGSAGRISVPNHNFEGTDE